MSYRECPKSAREASGNRMPYREKGSSRNGALRDSALTNGIPKWIERFVPAKKESENH